MRTLRNALLPALVAAGAACNIDTLEVVDAEARLSVVSLFAINDHNRVTLGWLDPPALRKVSDEDHGGGGDPADAGTPISTLVYRGGDPEFALSSGTLLGEVGPGINRFVDSSVRSGEVWYYRVVPVGLLNSGLNKQGRPSPAAVGRPYEYAAAGPIRFGEHIDRIFASGCAVIGCHGEGRASHDHDPLRKLAALDDDHSAGLSLASWADIFRGGAHGAVAIPFRPSKSHLLFHINDDTLLAPVSTPRMPPGGLRLPANQVRAVYDWIAAGCPDDRGAVPFSVYPQGKVLVTNQAEDLVAVIDRATNLVARYVRAGAADVFSTPPEAPHNVAVDEARGAYYVNLIGSGRVLKYDLETNAQVDEVGGIVAPTQIALSASGDTAYVAQFAQGVNSIRVIGTSPMRALGTISALNVDKPHGVTITPDGRELWVTGNLSDNVMVVTLADASTRLIQLDDQPPGQGGVLLPYQTVMTSDNAKAYVTCQRGNVVVVVDRSNDRVIRRIPVGMHPLIPSITPDDRYVLVPNRNSDDLSVIDTRTDSVVRTIAGIGPQPHGSAVTPDGRFAYVSCENVTSAVPPHHPTAGSKNPGFTTIVDLAQWRIVSRFETGAFAAGVAITGP